MKKLKLLLLNSLFSFSCIAQKHFEVKVQFPSSINLSQLVFYASDGKDNQKIKPNFKGRNAHFSGDFYGKYATLTIVYKGKNYNPFYKNSFWLNENPANITFTESDSTQNFLAFNKTQNAFELKKMGEDRFNDFVKVEQSDFDQFLKANPDFNTDSLTLKIFRQKANQLTPKKIEYIKKYPNDYFSLYVFRGLSAYSYANADSLKKYSNQLSQ